MTYIGSVKDAEKAMSDDKRVEQERIQGFCPEGVEDFARRWFGAIEPIVPVMSDDRKAAACAEAFSFANRMNVTLLSGMPAPVPGPTPEAQRIAALEAELAAARAALAAAADQALALVGQKPEAAQHSSEALNRACSVWPGRGGVSQLTGKGLWW